MKKLICWWRGLLLDRELHPYGGHTEHEIQRFSSTGQPFWETSCSVCGKSLGYWR